MMMMMVMIASRMMTTRTMMMMMMAALRMLMMLTMMTERRSVSPMTGHALRNPEPGANCLPCFCPPQVVEQNGAYFCEYDGKTSQTMRRRYVLQAKLMDFKADGWVSVFNDQVGPSHDTTRGSPQSLLEHMVHLRSEGLSPLCF